MDNKCNRRLYFRVQCGLDECECPNCAVAEKEIHAARKGEAWMELSVWLGLLLGVAIAMVVWCVSE